MPENEAAGTATCPRHPGEKVVGRCSSCGGEICRTCRDAHGYFCSDECKRAIRGQREPLEDAEAGERAKLAAFSARFDRWARIVKRYVLPSVALALVIVIIYKVTSRAGEVVWEFRPEKDLRLSEMTLRDGTLYVGCDDRALYAVDARTGEQRFRFETKMPLSGLKPVVTGKLKKRSGQRLCITWDLSNLYAVGTGSSSSTLGGKLAWKYALPGDVAGTPRAGREVLCFVCDFFKDPPPAEQSRLMGQTYYTTGGLSERDVRIKTGSSLIALDLASGKELWRKELWRKEAVTTPPWPVPRRADPSAALRGVLGGLSSFYPGSLAVQGGTVYYGGHEFGKEGSGHTVMALDHRTGKGKWKAGIKGAGFGTTVRATRKGVLVSTSRNLYLIAPDGRELWRAEKDERSCRPVVAGERVYVRTGGTLTCLALATGRKTWAVSLPTDGADEGWGSYGSPPVPGGRLVYVASFVKKPLKKKKGAASRPSIPAYKAPGVQDVLKQFAPEQPDYKLVPTLHALDAATGRIRWTKENVGGKLLCPKGRLISVDGASSLLGQLMGTGTVMTAIEPSSGGELWRHVSKHVGGTHAADGERLYFCVSTISRGLPVPGPVSSAAPGGYAIQAISIGR